MNRAIVRRLGLAGYALALCATGCLPGFSGDVPSDAATRDASIEEASAAEAATTPEGAPPDDTAQDGGAPDAGSADGAVARGCDDDGSPAVSGATRCSGLLQQTCTDGAWSTATPCTGAQACVGGACSLQLSIAAGPIQATMGLALTGVVANVTNAVGTGALSTVIAWGDGSQTSGSLGGAAGAYAVTGSHTYSTAASEAVTVTVSDTASGASAAVALKAMIDPAPKEAEFNVSNGEPNAIIQGPDGNPWFTDIGNNSVDDGTYSIKEYAAPTASSYPGGLVAGPNGVVYFTEISGNNIGEVSVGSSVTEIPVKTASSLPSFIAMASSPALPWFTEHNPAGGKIGRVNSDNSITEFVAPPAVVPFGICAGPDGNMWFTDTNGTVGLVTPSGSFTTFPLSDSSALPYAITAGPADGNLWFTEQTANKIARITPGGTITEFDVPTASSTPAYITAYNGALWFTENSADQIGRITTTGAFTEFTIPTASSSPAGIAAINNAIWFAELQGARIGQLVP